jgi:hypothetical protein
MRIEKVKNNEVKNGNKEGLKVEGFRSSRVEAKSSTSSTSELLNPCGHEEWNASRLH